MHYLPARQQNPCISLPLSCWPIYPVIVPSSTHVPTLDHSFANVNSVARATMHYHASTLGRRRVGKVRIANLPFIPCALLPRQLGPPGTQQTGDNGRGQGVPLALVRHDGAKQSPWPSAFGSVVDTHAPWVGSRGLQVLPERGMRFEKRVPSG